MGFSRKGRLTNSIYLGFGDGGDNVASFMVNKPKIYSGILKHMFYPNISIVDELFRNWSSVL